MQGRSERIAFGGVEKLPDAGVVERQNRQIAVPGGALDQYHRPVVEDDPLSGDAYRDDQVGALLGGLETDDDQPTVIGNNARAPQRRVFGDCIILAVP